jgi:hypothetical protein
VSDTASVLKNMKILNALIYDPSNKDRIGINLYLISLITKNRNIYDKINIHDIVPLKHNIFRYLALKYIDLFFPLY